MHRRGTRTATPRRRPGGLDGPLVLLHARRASREAASGGSGRERERRRHARRQARSRARTVPPLRAASSRQTHRPAPRPGTPRRPGQLPAESELERPGELLRRDSRAGVGDLDDDGPGLVIAAGTDARPILTVRRRVGRGVADEVGERSGARRPGRPTPASADAGRVALTAIGPARCDRLDAPHAITSSTTSPSETSLGTGGAAEQSAQPLSVTLQIRRRDERRCGSSTSRYPRCCGVQLAGAAVEQQREQGIGDRERRPEARGARATAARARPRSWPPARRGRRTAARSCSLPWRHACTLSQTESCRQRYIRPDARSCRVDFMSEGATSDRPERPRPPATLRSSG